jgi:hypothetical protein
VVESAPAGVGTGMLATTMAIGRSRMRHLPMRKPARKCAAVMGAIYLSAKDTSSDP